MEILKAKKLLEKVEGWKLTDNKIQRIYRFKDFQESIKFVNKVAKLAEDEGHHPDIKILWNKVTLALTTHAINGLSQNDFILAAKINQIQ